MIFVGVDPGMTGAVAAVSHDGALLWIVDTPILRIDKGKSIRHELNRPEMVRILESVKINAAVVAIERAGSMPGQGVASTFTFGVGFGVWLGILAALKIPHDIVHPTRWKKVMMDGMQKNKDASRVRAFELFGNSPALDLSKKKHSGRADSLLIAEWRRRQG